MTDNPSMHSSVTVMPDLVWTCPLAPMSMFLNPHIGKDDRKESIKMNSSSGTQTHTNVASCVSFADGSTSSSEVTGCHCEQQSYCSPQMLAQCQKNNALLPCSTLITRLEQQVKQLETELAIAKRQIRERDEDLKIEKVGRMEDNAQLEDAVVRERVSCQLHHVRSSQPSTDLLSADKCSEPAISSLQPVMDVYDIVVCSMHDRDKGDNMQPEKSHQCCVQDSCPATLVLSSKRKRFVHIEDELCESYERKRQCVRPQRNPLS
jgi:hypothetical protein